MRITQITPTDETGKREIYIDGQLFASLPADIVLSLDLRTGNEYDEAAAEQLIIRMESLRALQKAYTYLSYNALSCKKLKEKLAGAGFSDAAAEMALERLEELGLVDDTALALRLKSVMQASKHWGRRRASEELYKRGIASELCREVLADYEDEDALLWQLEHKYARKNLADPKERQRVTAGLVRLGFSFDDIRRALREFEDIE